MTITRTAARLAMAHPSWPLWRCMETAARLDAEGTR